MAGGKDNRRKADGAEDNDSNNRPGGTKIPLIIPECYDDGYAACVFGEPESICPHEIGTGSLRYSWLSGYLQAKFDQKEVYR